MNKLKLSIVINAKKEKVWDIMLGKEIDKILRK